MTPRITYDAENVFAKIIRGDIPSTKVLESPHAIAILDAFPVVPGHTLLLPRQGGFATLADMPGDAASEVLKELPRLVRAIMEATGAEGVNIIQNNGAAAGQEVFHVHFHLIPRSMGDGLVRLAPSSKQMLGHEQATAMANEIRTRLEASTSAGGVPPAPGSPLARVLGAHDLVLAVHAWVHVRVNSIFVRMIRFIFGGRLG
mmetsp:Transcript_14207/g.36780  ORF Transcript_14207/g.36780 Transcript_14207/m.36780 type:complete len:202 (+) Transcript_14207:63-668(+)